MSISGNQSEGSEEANKAFIETLKKYGEVLTEHFSNPSLIGIGESKLTNKGIHDRDMEWLLSADVIVAEVSNASLGVGYEIGRAVENGKKILCLRRKQKGRLSAMISGCERLELREYENLDDGILFIDEYFKLNNSGK